MAEIILDRITKKYGGFTAMKDQSLTVHDGEFLVLLGPSGCGKTTTMRLIAGLEDITEGEIRIGGKVVNTLPPKDRDIAMVFQNYGLYPKGNYSIIGPGVTASSKQVINLPEPHGFNIGATSMSHGITNNLHLHFTAEVFMVYAGSWTFRGFTNTGPDDGWLFTTLGGDNTGGIIWHPSILDQAASADLYLTKDGVLVDTEDGDEKPAEADLLHPIAQADMDKLRNFTPEEMRRRVIMRADLAWRADALLDSCLPGHASAIAPVIGNGIAQGGGMVAPVRFAHGFSQEWLRLAPGQSVSRHRIAEKQVMIPYTGTAELVLNEAGDVTRRVGPRDTFSCPGGVWRAIRNTGDAVLEVLLITPGEQRKRIEWPSATLAAARAAVAQMRIGPQIAAGVPALAVPGRDLALALKSGNFGQPDFFARALRVLEGG